MKVLGVGFGRTGTASLKQALELLGLGPCFNMQTVLDEPQRAEHWLAAAAGRVGWDEVFAGFQSTVDWPGAAFWRELVGHWPDAKVILTVRDPEQWCESMSRTIFRPSTRWDRTLRRIRQRADPRATQVHHMIRTVVAGGVFDGRAGDRQHLLEVFRRHTADVVKAVPADALLIYHVGDGWAPLCRFLGVAEPARPFPAVNRAASFRRRELYHVARTVRGAAKTAVDRAAVGRTGQRSRGAGGTT